MGKGVPAALFAAILRSVTRMVAETTTAPAEMLTRINALMADELSAVDMFITAQLAVIDKSARHLTVGSAGHCPLLVRDRKGRLRTISPAGMPLGISKDAHYGEEIIALSEVSCALLYSDGLTEAQGPTGELFGQENLEHWLQAADAKSGALTLQQDLISHLHAFAAGSTARDDQTCVFIAAQPGGSKSAAETRTMSSLTAEAG